jgi:hypothetical protein
MATFSQTEVYEIAAAVLDLVLIVPSFILAVLSLFKCRTAHDAARSTFNHLKVALGFFCLYLFFNIVSRTLYVVYVQAHISTALYDAINYIFQVVRLFQHVVAIMVFLALSSLGVGILAARDAAPLKHHTTLIVVIRSAAGLLAILAVTYFGVALEYRRSLERGTFQGNRRAFLRARQLSNIVDIFVFVASVAVLGFAVLLRVKAAKTHARLHKVQSWPLSAHENRDMDAYLESQACNTLLVCSVLWLIQNLFIIIWVGIYSSFTDTDSSADEPTVSIILFFVFIDLVWFVVFLLLFLLGKRKATVAGGLWSAQPAPQHGGQDGQYGQYGQYVQYVQPIQPQYGPVQTMPAHGVYVYENGNGQAAPATTWQQPATYPQMTLQPIYLQGGGYGPVPVQTATVPQTVHDQPKT